jgi:hypothetical protein
MRILAWLAGAVGFYVVLALAVLVAQAIGQAIRRWQS